MYVIIVDSYLDKMNLVPLTYTQTYLFKRLLHLIRKHLPTVFGRAYDMV